MMKIKLKNLKGFTLIELLSVIAVVAVLSAILIPVLSQFRSKSDNTKCMSNLRQLALASRLYANENKGNPGMDTWSWRKPANTYWHRRIFPYLVPGRTEADWGDEKLWRQDSDMKDGWVYACPSSDNEKSRGYYTMTYAMNRNIAGRPIWTIEDPTRVVWIMDFSEGHLAVGTQSDLEAHLPVFNDHNWHKGFANVAFVDGHVEHLEGATIPSVEDDPAFWGVR